MSTDNTPTLGWTNFALTNSTKAKGNSYTTLSNEEVVERVLAHWDRRTPGDGEGDCLDRKVLVPVDPEGFFLPPVAKLVMGMPVHAEVVKRQDHEDPFVQTFVAPQDAAKFGAEVEVPADFVQIVCYSHEALSENNEKPDTDCDWEIVCLLCSKGYKSEPMLPLAMARNMLEKPGGTKGVYTAQQFAEAIWYWSQKGIRIREPSQ